MAIQGRATYPQPISNRLDAHVLREKIDGFGERVL